LHHIVLHLGILRVTFILNAKCLFRVIENQWLSILTLFPIHALADLNLIKYDKCWSDVIMMK